MSLKKERREQIEKAIFDAIGVHYKGTALVQSNFARDFGISAQSVSRIIKNLEKSGRLIIQKNGRNTIYSLPTERKLQTYEIKGLTEEKVYNELVADFIRDIPMCAKNNFAYAFTEILNNAIEHSNGTMVQVSLWRNECDISFAIADDGVGVFTKVAESLNLEDKRYAIFELAKGKFTTDPGSHSGEGIFFSSKCGDYFTLESDGLIFDTRSTMESLCEHVSNHQSGTTVLFKINTNHQQTLAELFKQYTDAPDSYGFSKTSVPIRLLEYGDASPVFVSRSQARRLIARLERFETVILDFSGIDSIGQGFADEIFRVFQRNHPHVKLTPVNCTDEVNQMIRHVMHNKS